MSFKHKRIVIVNAGNGIGKRIAQKLLEGGASVMISDAFCDLLSEAESEIRKTGNVQSCLADVRRSDEAEMLAQSALFKLGGIDTWINIIENTSACEGFTEQDPVTWKTAFEKSLYSVFNCCRAVLPYFQEQKAGRIVNANYESDRMSQYGQSIHSVSMAAIVEFTRALSREVGQYNIYANVVTLGNTLRENHEMIEASKRREMVHHLIRQTSLQRLGNMDDAANAVLFMASDQASWITGQNLISNGGQFTFD